MFRMAGGRTSEWQNCLRFSLLRSIIICGHQARGVNLLDDSAQLPQPIRSLLNERGIVNVSAAPSGMSGARVFRCHDRSGSVFAVKRWPAGTAAKRVDEVHSVTEFARQSGCKMIPPLIPWHDLSQGEFTSAKMRFTIDRHHWDAMPWMPGASLPIDCDLEQVSAGVATIAAFHAAVSELGSQIQPAPAVRSRLNRLVELDRLIPNMTSDAMVSREIARLDPPLASALNEGLQLLKLQWHPARQFIESSLRPFSTRNLPTQYVLRDVHRGHILFDSGQVTGLIDFDAIRIDTPLMDLARWAGDFVIEREDIDSVWEAILAGLPQNWAFLDSGETHPLPLLRTLHAANVWISLANWVDWVILQRRTFAIGPDRVAARVQQLVQGAGKTIVA